MIDVVVCGAAGRTGRTLIRLIQGEEKLRIRGAIEAPNHPLLNTATDGGVKITSRIEEALEPGMVVVEFSTPAATMEHLEAIKRMKVCAVVGTTGFNADQQKRIEEIGTMIPLVQSHNYGLGMNYFYFLVQQATALLQDGFDIEIVEFHGREKRDAPSGTAGTIASKITGVKGLSVPDVAVFSRKGLRDGERHRDEIGISSVRGGCYKSEHTVIFAGMGERIELTHREEAPEIIVRGAMKAIEYIHGRAPGYYGMEDVLGLKKEGIPGTPD